MEDICSAMSRKTRTRQTRIHAALQSGYCAICHIPYNSLNDHIQSKKHLKLIGEDANYISINGFIDQNNLMPFLNLNGIDSIDINGKQIEKELCPRLTRNAKNRGICEMLETPPPTHHLRSRKQINYAISPSLDDDSSGEKQETVFKTPCKEKKNNNCNNSATFRQIAKPQFLEDDPSVELWNSGRPKRRSCIKAKRTSADERLVADNKIYYKVEVLTNKLRSSSQHQVVKESESKQTPEIQVHEHVQEVVKDDKGFVVKFKKLRNSELTLLNNEAENFLFPKKDDEPCSDEECQRVTTDSILSSDGFEDFKPKHEVEDDASMDSTTSSGKRRKRRTHAEAFIMDNQKYYKFETPGSRLRYHGSFFPDVKSPKHETSIEKREHNIPVVKKECDNKFLDFEHYRFSFETVPSGEKWYEPFRRQDIGDESYIYLPNDENRMVLPYQMSSNGPALDPKVCITQYAQLRKFIQEQSTSSTGSRTSCSTPESMDTPTLYDDDDSKSSETTCHPNNICEETKKTERRGKTHLGSDKNPRKSPRQHASTLAILSSLLHQRRSRKLKGGNGETLKLSAALPTIPEQDTPTTDDKMKDYEDILSNIDDKTVDFMDELVESLEQEEAVEFSNKLDILDVLRIHDEIKMRDDHRTNRRFINGTPGRKPGRRKKLNKTGWPNRKKGLVRLVKNNGTTDVNFKAKLGINCDLNRVKVGRKFKNNNVKANMDSNVVVVRKVSTGKSDEVVKKCVVRRTNGNKRKMPASPKSPRILRKPRGKWYKER